MSSEKSDEFSLDGLEDLDLSESAEDLETASLEEDGLDLNLSDESVDFSLSEEGEEVPNVTTPDPNEFSLTNVALNISLAEDDEEVPSEEVVPDMIDLGDESKDDFSLSDDEDSLSNFDDSGEDFSLGDDSEELSDFSLSDDLPESEDEAQSPADESLDFGSGDISDEEDLFGLSDDSGEEVEAEAPAPSNPLQDYSSPSLTLNPEDMTAEVRAKLQEIDAIMQEDATRGAFIMSSTDEEDDLDLSGTDESIPVPSNEDEELKFDEVDDGANDSDMNLDLDESTIEEEPLDENAFSMESLGDDSQEEVVTEEPSFEASDDMLQTVGDEPLVGDLNLSDLDLEEEGPAEVVVQEEAPAPVKKKKKKETAPAVSAVSAQHLEDISQAYTGEMERTQATIANLRADRDELLKKIDSLEEEKLLGHRNTLSLRAELDEKKIELTIIRKKLNEEINELKDRIRIYEEKVLILEEKNKQLHHELETAGQKNKIDVKRVMLRERELEQKLELLKADAETQIRNRDLKILELKRKIDAMEFDMESIAQQEKKTLESRFELEDKLDKAIRTLRTAISTLEEDGNRSATLEAIKKNIEM